MSEGAADFEALVRRAMPPVEPPAELEVRLEMTLGSLVEAAADEFEAWELSAMRDPRNWVRPVAAIAVGTAAGAGLIVLGWRHQHRRQRSMRVAAGEVRRLVRR
jgi:hypothetical protein